MSIKRVSKCPCFHDCVESDASSIRVLLHTIVSLPSPTPELAAAVELALQDATLLSVDLRACDIPKSVVDAIALAADLLALETLAAQLARDDVLAVTLRCEALSSKVEACVTCRRSLIVAAIEEIRSKLKALQQIATGDVLVQLKAASDLASALLTQIEGPAPAFAAAVDAFVALLHSIELLALAATPTASVDIVTAVIAVERDALKMRHMVQCRRYEDFDEINMKIKCYLFAAERLAMADPAWVTLLAAIRAAEVQAEDVFVKIELPAPRPDIMADARHLVVLVETAEQTADSLKAHEIKNHIAHAERHACELIERLKCEKTAFLLLTDSLLDKLVKAEPLIPTADLSDATAVALMQFVLEAEQLVDRLKCQLRKCTDADEWMMLWSKQLIADIRVHLDAAIQLADQLQDVAVKALLLEAQPLVVEIASRLVEDHVEDHLFNIEAALSDAESIVVASTSAQLKTNLLVLQLHLADIHILVHAERLAEALKQIDRFIFDTKTAETMADDLHETDAKAKIIASEIEETALKAAVQRRASS